MIALKEVEPLAAADNPEYGEEIHTCIFNSSPENNIIDSVHVGDTGSPALVVEPHPDVIKGPTGKTSQIAICKHLSRI